LARALYSDADILLLDDILSAVDAHVGAFLFNETLREYLRGKTIILVTHALNFIKQADRVIVIEDGRILSNGTFKELSDHSLLPSFELSITKREKEGDER
jgi:ABC-type multidrug transport system fused ATPase/permease subunit